MASLKEKAQCVLWYHKITLLDLLLWGYVKDKLFSTPVPDITNLRARITGAFAIITEDIVENTWREIRYRLDVLLLQLYNSL
jgi:hypothetical protein